MLIANKEVTLSGRLFKTAHLRDEYYDYPADPVAFVQAVRQARLGAALFTFLQEGWQSAPQYPFLFELESSAVIPLKGYDQWWKDQIDCKTRNMIRKAGRNGVEVRIATYDDTMVKQIMEIYNESPMRQGKPFKHYGKSFEFIKESHGTFLDTSDFIGAYLQGELIGFAKLVHGNGVSHLMQIIGKIGQRDKAPMNLLIAKAVEICCSRGIPNLRYGVWSRRGGLFEFKKNHAFQQVDVPRYFVALNPLGHMILALKLHRSLSQRLPTRWVDFLADRRAKWNSYKFAARKA